SDRGLLLDVIFSHEIQPQLRNSGAKFVYDFPQEQSAYAQLQATQPPVASRFELLMDGIELANGYHEVTSLAEQLRRFETERTLRRFRGLRDMPNDPSPFSQQGLDLPPCAGVAIGLDRLLMIACGADSLSAVEMR
ncbi:MAG: amino acid--tRNA ligase-related protein, partial [Pseudomonadota bacterium]